MTPRCDLFHFLQKVSRLRQMWGRTRITNEQPPGCFRINISVSLTSTLMTTLKPGLFIPQSHAPLSLTTTPPARPPAASKYPSLPSRVEREYRADDGFISSVSLCTKRPCSPAPSPLSLFLVRKAARKGLTRSVSHTLRGQHWLIPNAFNLDLN